MLEKHIHFVTKAKSSAQQFWEWDKEVCQEVYNEIAVIYEGQFSRSKAWIFLFGVVTYNTQAHTHAHTQISSATLKKMTLFKKYPKCI